MNHEGKGETSYQMEPEKTVSSANSNVVEYLESIKEKSPQIRVAISFVSCYFLVKLMYKKFAENMISSTTNLAFGCILNSLSKPTPLKLDVSLPSLQDIRWNMSRLLYLFNRQLERNVATFLIVLIAACFSFVIIGVYCSISSGAEDCFWEAWACLCSSSTHLRQRTRIERVIGFILDVWGIQFYSRLLSTMTEQFRNNMQKLRDGSNHSVIPNPKFSISVGVERDLEQTASEGAIVVEHVNPSSGFKHKVTDYMYNNPIIDVNGAPGEYQLHSAISEFDVPLSAPAKTPLDNNQSAAKECPRKRGRSVSCSSVGSNTCRENKGALHDTEDQDMAYGC